MGFILPGFPEHTAAIDMPDIGELMCYPTFQNADISEVFKQGTEFQKYLLDRVPLKHDKKYITVHSMTTLVNPDVRPITMYGTRDPMEEWHIDGVNESDYQTGPERVHLLISHAKARTEFLAEPVDFSYLPTNLPRKEFHGIFRSILRTNPLKTKMIDENVIYTFTNHMHRPTVPKGIELRYTLRVRETNKTEPPTFGKEASPTQIQVRGYGSLHVLNGERVDGKISYVIPDASLFKKGEDRNA